MPSTEIEIFSNSEATLIDIKVLISTKVLLIFFNSVGIVGNIDAIESSFFFSSSNLMATSVDVWDNSSLEARYERNGLLWEADKLNTNSQFGVRM